MIEVAASLLRTSALASARCGLSGSHVPLQNWSSTTAPSTAENVVDARALNASWVGSIVRVEHVSVRYAVSGPNSGSGFAVSWLAF